METKVTVPLHATFFVRDGKQARDAGDLATMQFWINKVSNDPKMDGAQKDLAILKIRNAPYRPNPTKAPSGCVTPGYSRIYKAHQVQDPLALAQAKVEALHAAGILTDEEADERLAIITERTSAKAAEILKAQKALALKELDALLA